MSFCLLNIRWKIEKSRVEWVLDIFLPLASNYIMNENLNRKLFISTLLKASPGFFMTFWRQRTSATETTNCLHSSNSILNFWLIMLSFAFTSFYHHALIFRNQRHKRISLLRARKVVVEGCMCRWKKTTKRREKEFLSFLCLPFGGFCGFSFHLENILNDTHLLNMVNFSLPSEASKKNNTKMRNC